MNRMTLIALLAATSTASFAQAPPPMPTAPRVAQRAVQDPSMVIGHDKGAIEVLAAHRAAPVSAKHGKSRVQIMRSTKFDTIGPDRLGVVYNHGLKAQGYINGEITFQLKRGATDGAFDPL